MTVDTAVNDSVLRFRTEQIERLQWLLKNKVSNFIHCDGCASSASQQVVHYVCERNRDTITQVFRIDCADYDGDERLICAELNRLMDDCEQPADASDVDWLSCRMDEFVRQQLPSRVCLQLANVQLMGAGSSLLHTCIQLTQKQPPFVLLTLSHLPLHACVNCAHLRHEPPVNIRFPGFDKPELSAILCADLRAYLERKRRDFPEEINDDLVTFYSQQIVNTCAVVTRDLSHLRAVAFNNWRTFIAPVCLEDEEPNKIHATDKMRLWNHFRQILQPQMRRGLFVTETEAATASEADMPRAHKLLLTAAYLASYNPPKFDRRFFVKGLWNEQHNRHAHENGSQSFRHGSHQARKSAKSGACDQRQQLHTRGPQPFVVQRVSHIACALARENTVLDRQLIENIMPALQSLVECGFVRRASAAGNLDVPKYRCAFDLQTITPIAKAANVVKHQAIIQADNDCKSLDINIKHYLADFNST